MGTDDFALGAGSGWKISQGGADSEGSEPMCQERSISRSGSQIISEDTVSLLLMPMGEPIIWGRKEHLQNQVPVSEMELQNKRVGGPG